MQLGGLLPSQPPSQPPSPGAQSRSAAPAFDVFLNWDLIDI